jgi:hypothetical protein
MLITIFQLTVEIVITLWSQYNQIDGNLDLCEGRFIFEPAFFSEILYIVVAPDQLKCNVTGIKQNQYFLFSAYSY